MDQSLTDSQWQLIHPLWSTLAPLPPESHQQSRPSSMLPSLSSFDRQNPTVKSNLDWNLSHGGLSVRPFSLDQALPPSSFSFIQPTSPQLTGTQGSCGRVGSLGLAFEMVKKKEDAAVLELGLAMMVLAQGRETKVADYRLGSWDEEKVELGVVP